jgi:hypothetical protein
MTNDDRLLAQAGLALALAYQEGFNGRVGDPNPATVFRSILSRLGARLAEDLRQLDLTPYH